MPNVGDELHHFGWNRCSSACHGPDRSHLIVPGFRSSRIHVINVADDPRRPRIEKVIEPRGADRRDRAIRGRTPCTACRATTSSISMLGDARGQRRGRLRRPRREDVRGQGPLGERRLAARAQLRLLVPAAQERARLVASSGSRTPTRAASTSPTSRPAATASRLHFWNLRDAVSSSRRSTSATNGLIPLEVRWKHDPDADEGFVGAAAVQRPCGASTATTAPTRPSR